MYCTYLSLFIFGIKLQLHYFKVDCYQLKCFITAIAFNRFW